MQKYTFEQFAAVRSYADLSWSPDGRSVAYTSNLSGQLNVWRQSTSQTPDGDPAMPLQLTGLTEQAARRAVWSPDGSRILTAVDRQGNENFQLYEVPAADGWLYPITDVPTARHVLGDEPWSPDGKLLAYASNERTPKDMDVVVRDLEAGETRPLLAGDANFFAMSWSPDGRSVLAIQAIQNTDQNLWLCDVASGETRLLTPHEASVLNVPGPWRPDGSGFYLLTDRDREHTGLAFYSLDSGALEWVATPEWDVEAVAVSPDGRYLAYVVNEDGWSRLYVRDLPDGDEREFPKLPRGVYSDLRFSPTETLLALMIAQPTRPKTIFLLNVESSELRHLTQSYFGGVPESAMVRPTLVRFPTHDGREIPAFLYRPPNAVGGTRVPVVLSIHGGPEAQERPGYNYYGLYQYLLNRGIGVLATNIRGSTGYGKAYQKLIYRDWGGAELGDLVHAALYLRGLPWVDGERLGVFGGSFGGFATLSCVTRLPQYWAAAVDIVGPSNLITFTRAVPEFWKRLMREWVGDPDEDADLLRERSPITYVDNARAPLLVIQGANDPRVVKGESDQMVARLRELGRTVEYMVFEDEGHGFTKTSNQLAAMKASAEWFERHLLNDER